jgi:hypothetical protein
MNYKVIEKEDYKKARNNFYKEEYRSRLSRRWPYNAEYEGCLFIYDEEFRKEICKSALFARLQ